MIFKTSSSTNAKWSWPNNWKTKCLRKDKITMSLRFLIDMKSVRNIKFAGLVVMACLAMSAAFAQEPATGETPTGGESTAGGESTGESNSFVVDKIIAKVDNYIVTKSELEQAYQDYVTNGGSPSPQAKCQYLAML